jgi:hypothetical protein
MNELNADNKVFLTARFLAASPEEMAAPYRRIVKQVFNPDRGASNGMVWVSPLAGYTDFCYTDNQTIRMSVQQKGAAGCRASQSRSPNAGW